MTRIRIQGGRVLDPATGRDELLDLDIEDGRIAAVGPKLSGPCDGTEEAEGLWLAPGLVDLHTHLREPGQEYKETIETGTRSAARGGFTSICCMANTDPVNDSPAITDFILRQSLPRHPHVETPVPARAGNASANRRPGH